MTIETDSEVQEMNIPATRPASMEALNESVHPGRKSPSAANLEKLETSVQVST